MSCRSCRKPVPDAQCLADWNGVKPLRPFGASYQLPEQGDSMVHHPWKVIGKSLLFLATGMQMGLHCSR